MHKYGRKDNNHNFIVKDLNRLGYEVMDLSSLGNGRPDILVLSSTVCQLFEIKSDKGKLTKDQVDYIGKMKLLGIIIPVVKTTEEILIYLGIK